jgi:predicted glycosyltransferase
MSGVLFHVQHLLGVGHMARAAALTRGMTAAGLEVTVVTGGMPVPGMDFGRADVVELPPVRAADTSFKVLLDGAGDPIDASFFARRRDVLLGLHRKLAPDAILIEHYPFGRQKFAAEIEPLLMAARGRAAILCSLRDVLVESDAPAKSARAVAAVQRSFDRILVHGDRKLLPLELTFPRAADIAERLLYTGYVVDRRVEPASQAPADAGWNEIIVSIGGGAVGLELLVAAIGAMRLGAGGGRHWRLLAGTNLAEGDYQMLRRAAPIGLTVERARPDFPDLLARAALSVSQAGYNTLMELVKAGCRNILVPFSAGKESEQMLRARVFERHGLVNVLDEAALTPSSLAGAVERALEAPPPQGPGGIDLDGVATTARTILGMIEAKRG